MTEIVVTHYRVVEFDANKVCCAKYGQMPTLAYAQENMTNLQEIAGVLDEDHTFEVEPVAVLWEVDSQGTYVYKSGNSEYHVPATVRDIHGSAIRIEFRNPKSGVLTLRELRTAEQKARLLTGDEAVVIASMKQQGLTKVGAPFANQNAVKEGLHRELITLSLKDERLKRVASYLATEHKPLTTANLRVLAYDALDAYLS